ncbi:MAG: lysozyme inhibitor LprI family protein, partial [Terracidiphilus sp.]
LTADRTCAAAYARLAACEWGSSADARFAAIVIKKCVQTFLPKFSPQETARFNEEMYLCNYEYARQEGTLAISEESICHADVAADFSAHPELAREPLPRASFDCNKASTPLEKAICTNPQLGRADVVLGRVYEAVLREAPAGEKPALVASQRKWLKSVPARCGLGLSAPVAATVNCIRNAFELRFLALDGCGVSAEGIADCAG